MSLLFLKMETTKMLQHITETEMSTQWNTVQPLKLVMEKMTICDIENEVKNIVL